jgi:hypothetical protein
MAINRIKWKLALLISNIYQNMAYVKNQQSTDYIKCLYCDEKDENKY